MSAVPRMSAASTPLARLGASFAASLRPVLLLRESPVGMIGGGIVVGFVILAIFAEFIAPFDPNATMVPFAFPGAEAPDGRIFLLGTDHLGGTSCRGSSSAGSGCSSTPRRRRSPRTWWAF